MNFRATIKLPSAFLPVIMSIAAIVLVLGCVALFGITRGGDEGAAAHLWQLLIVGQLPFVAYFAFRWLPRTPRSALPVLLLQVVAGLAAVAPVYLLHL
jgi:hypothetical protein